MTRTRFGQRLPASRIAAWSELRTLPTSRGVTSPSTRSRPTIRSACRIWSSVTVEFVPRPITTKRGSERARARSTPMPSLI